MIDIEFCVTTERRVYALGIRRNSLVQRQIWTGEQQVRMTHIVGFCRAQDLLQAERRPEVMSLNIALILS